MGDTYNDDVVAKQLNYLGLLQVIKIRQSGFPIRKPMKVFYEE